MEVKRKNNRRYNRHPVPFCAWLEFREDESIRAMRSLDVSTEGARFSTIRPVAKDEPVMVRLEVRPGAPAVECKGRVCWVELMQGRIRHFGVRFVDLADDERTKIDHALREATSRQSMAVI